MTSRATLNLVAGILLILEGVGVILIGITFLTMGAIAAGLGALAFFAMMIGVFLGSAGAVLTGLLHLDGRPFSICMLIFGCALSVLAHGVMFTGACGVNCPGAMPDVVYSWPLLLGVFNALCAVLLWFKQPRGGATRKIK